MDERLAGLFLRVANLLPKSLLARFDKIKSTLAKASIKTGFEFYVGLVMFACFVCGVSTFVFSFLLAGAVGLALAESLLWSLVVAFISVLVTIGIGYLYPVLVAYSRGSGIDANLPHIAHFMAVLASSGMTPENVFVSLARVGKEYKVNKEVLTLIGEIELLGTDLYASLKRISDVSPSKKFGSLLNGIVSTSHMGGDLADYLNQEAMKFKEDRVSKIKRFLENLGVIAESYVAFMVAAPLMLIIMLSVMSYIGGQVAVGTLNPIDILNLLTFVLIPVGVGFLIFMVDSITPLR